jgi:hypothetical protein
VDEIWEVAGGPALCELENWGWQTPVVLRRVRDPGIGLDDLAVKPMSLSRATRLRLSVEQERRLRAISQL